MTARTLIAAAVFVCAGCSQTRHYHEARPVSAELQIWTVDPKTGEPRWITQTREVYRYEEDDERDAASKD